MRGDIDAAVLAGKSVCLAGADLSMEQIGAMSGLFQVMNGFPCPGIQFDYDLLAGLTALVLDDAELGFIVFGPGESAEVSIGDPGAK